MIPFAIHTAACLAGLLLARWATGRQADMLAGFWGICATMLIAGAATLPAWWLLPGTPLFLYLLFRRRKTGTAGR